MRQPVLRLSPDRRILFAAAKYRFSSRPTLNHSAWTDPLKCPGMNQNLIPARSSLCSIVEARRQDPSLASTVALAADLKKQEQKHPQAWTAGLNPIPGKYPSSNAAAHLRSLNSAAKVAMLADSLTREPRACSHSDPESASAVHHPY
jgi:hypothetical protein